MFQNIFRAILHPLVKKYLHTWWFQSLLKYVKQLEHHPSPQTFSVAKVSYQTSQYVGKPLWIRVAIDKHRGSRKSACHHENNGASFWIMIHPYPKNMVNFS